MTERLQLFTQSLTIGWQKDCNYSYNQELFHCYLHNHELLGDRKITIIYTIMNCSMIERLQLFTQLWTIW
jgi:hypothetical protein